MFASISSISYRTSAKLPYFARGRSHPLIFSSLRSLLKNPLDILEVQLFVDLLQDFISLLETVEHRHLDQRELYRRDLRGTVSFDATCVWRHTHQLLQVLQLAICLRKERLLVLSPAQCEHRTVLVPRRQLLLRNLTLSIEDTLDLRGVAKQSELARTPAGDNPHLFLVLLDFVALELQTRGNGERSATRSEGVMHTLEDGTVLLGNLGD